MPQVRVSALARTINAASLVKGGDAVITSITNDSRSVTQGSLYAALPGAHVDGHAFIGDAVRAGASAILCSEPPGALPAGVAVLVSDRPRLALSEISAAFFGAPSRSIRVIGVTGTDGKTSTVHYIHQLLSAMGRPSAFLSTAAAEIDEGERANLLHQSTPEAPVVHGTIARMAAAGKRYAVLESTSHGLSARSCRLAHVHYSAAVLTSLTHEHLEYHGTFANYRHDKANLFRALDAGCYAAADGFAAEGEDVSPAPGQSPAAHEGRWSSLADAGLRADLAAGAPFGVINLGCVTTG